MGIKGCALPSLVCRPHHVSSAPSPCCDASASIRPASASASTQSFHNVDSSQGGDGWEQGGDASGCRAHASQAPSHCPVDGQAGGEGQGVGSSRDGLSVGVEGRIQLVKTRTACCPGGRSGGVALPVQCAYCGSHQEGDGSFRCPLKLNTCTGPCTGHIYVCVSVCLSVSVDAHVTDVGSTRLVACNHTRHKRYKRHKRHKRHTRLCGVQSQETAETQETQETQEMVS